MSIFFMSARIILIKIYLVKIHSFLYKLFHFSSPKLINSEIISN